MRHSPFTVIFDPCVLYPHPPQDVDAYLNILLRQGLVQTVKALATYRAIL
jgi:hypothetical protein